MIGVSAGLDLLLPPYFFQPIGLPATTWYWDPLLATKSSIPKHCTASWRRARLGGWDTLRPKVRINGVLRTKLSSVFSPGGARPWGLLNGVLRAELSWIFDDPVSFLKKGKFRGVCFPDFKGELSRIFCEPFSLLKGGNWGAFAFPILRVNYREFSAPIFSFLLRGKFWTWGIEDLCRELSAPIFPAS